MTAFPWRQAGAENRGGRTQGYSWRASFRSPLPPAPKTTVRSVIDAAHGAHRVDRRCGRIAGGKSDVAGMAANPDRPVSPLQSRNGAAAAALVVFHLYRAIPARYQGDRSCWCRWWDRGRSRVISVARRFTHNRTPSWRQTETVVLEIARHIAGPAHREIVHADTGDRRTRPQSKSTVVSIRVCVVPAKARRRRRPGCSRCRQPAEAATGCGKCGSVLAAAPCDTPRVSVWHQRRG